MSVGRKRNECRGRSPCHDQIIRTTDERVATAEPCQASHRRALLRLLTVPLITVGVHSATRFSAWLLVPLGIVAAALVAGTDFPVPGFRFLSRLNRVDRLAIWIVLVCLIVIGYLHNANTWTPSTSAALASRRISPCGRPS